MDEKLFKTFFPDEYTKRFLQADLRSDGRKFTEFRTIEVFTKVSKTSFGSSIVKIGDTLVMCFLEGTLARKSLGKITYVSKTKAEDKCLEVEVTLNKNEEYETSRREKISKEAYIGSFLQQKFLAQYTNLMDLVTIPNSTLYWKLVANVKVMNNHGNILDAGFLAMMTALITVSLPEINLQTFKEETMTYETLSTKRLPFSEKDLFIPFNFKKIDPNYILLDPNFEEEGMPGTEFSILLQNSSNDVIFTKHTSRPIKYETIQEYIELTRKLSKPIFQSLGKLFDKNVNHCSM